MVFIGLVLNSSFHHPTATDSTEEVIARTIQGIQKIIRVHVSPKAEGGEVDLGIPVSLAMKRHWELKIRMLRDAPTEEMKLRQILKVKQKEYEKATDWEDTERLFPEIEMLKFVLFLVCRR